ncbi:MAG: hypothetical protein JRJ54_13645, partial [Deltaproteobacteria bacterium]|nr:hypothetical protein [Deltaproteobacteria bacterium]
MKETDYKLLELNSSRWPSEKRIRFEGPPILGQDQLVLKPGEILHFFSDTQVYETKIIKRTYRGYAGTRVKIGSIPIYLGGSFPHTTRNEATERLGQGRFFVTNQRIVCIGKTFNFNIMLDHIASIEEYADAIQIAGEGLSGQKLFILKDSHIANMTIGALLKYQVMDEPLWIDALAAGSFQDLQILIFR